MLNLFVYWYTRYRQTQYEEVLKMPEISRSVPAYEQIADHYRTLIRSGQLAAGEKLPSITEIATEWGVARATASQAINRLQVEHAVHTSTQGTFVSADGIISATPGDRIRMARPYRVGPGESVVVTAAEIVIPPDYVNDLLNITPGREVIRREEITSLRGQPIMLSVDWIPVDSTLTALGVLDDKPLEGGLAHTIESITHRHITHGQDHLRGRSADTRETAALQIPVGSPILAGVHIWSDSKDVILYGEWVMPPDQVVTYTYDVPTEQ
jgi:GntR family transcriptional regulator